MENCGALRGMASIELGIQERQIPLQSSESTYPIEVAAMFATLHPDSEGHDMVAVEASTQLPVSNRPPHVVCQLCRSKKVPVPRRIIERLGLIRASN